MPKLGEIWVLDSTGRRARAGSSSRARQRAARADGQPGAVLVPRRPPAGRWRGRGGEVEVADDGGDGEGGLQHGELHVSEKEGGRERGKEGERRERER